MLIRYIFYSDGPTSQNKQKLNFYLFSTELFEHGFKKGYCNFHTAGHEKCIPDGIGASLKRAADIRVKHGEDVVSASQFIKQMHESGSKVEVYQMQEQDIKEIERKVKDKKLKAIPGTITIHQRRLNIDKSVVYVMRNVAMVTNCALSNSRVIPKNQNKVVQRNQNKIRHKTHFRTAEENQTRMGDIRQRNI